MKPEEKDLLLRDLCARLPYNVICQFKTSTPLTMYANTYDDVLSRDNMYRLYEDGSLVRPYLRPMSSMTRKEFDEYNLFSQFSEPADVIDWLNAHHFDYRDLIEKGLALEAPEGMYKTE